MKRLFVAASVFGLTISSPAQGYIALNNYFNTSSSPTATSNGRFFHTGITFNPPILTTQDFNAAFYGGTDPDNLSLIASFSGVATVGSSAAGPGTWTDPSAGVYAVPGTTAASTMAFFRIEAWTGFFSSFSQALEKNNSTYQLVFSNPVGSIENPPDLTGMPSICMGICVTPESGTFALTSLGGIMLLLFIKTAPRRTPSSGMVETQD